uniref:BRCT domain-containing protein n=1 Tax=Panagrellus redivivus TaxID=6233 RepID=A0A7E4VV17_PANRE
MAGPTVPIIHIDDDSDSELDYVQIHTPRHGICEIQPGDDGEISMAELELLMPVPSALILIKGNRRTLVKPRNGVFKKPKDGWAADKVIAVENIPPTSRKAPSLPDSSRSTPMFGLGERGDANGTLANVMPPEMPGIMDTSADVGRMAGMNDRAASESTMTSAEVAETKEKRKAREKAPSPEELTTPNGSAVSEPVSMSSVPENRPNHVPVPVSTVTETKKADVAEEASLPMASATSGGSDSPNSGSLSAEMAMASQQNTTSAPVQFTNIKDEPSTAKKTSPPEASTNPSAPVKNDPETGPTLTRFAFTSNSRAVSVPKDSIHDPKPSEEAALPPTLTNAPRSDDVPPSEAQSQPSPEEEDIQIVKEKRKKNKKKVVQVKDEPKSPEGTPLPIASTGSNAPSSTPSTVNPPLPPSDALETSMEPVLLMRDTAEVTDYPGMPANPVDATETAEPSGSGNLPTSPSAVTIALPKRSLPAPEAAFNQTEPEEAVIPPKRKRISPPRHVTPTLAISPILPSTREKLPSLSAAADRWVDALGMPSTMSLLDLPAFNSRYSKYAPAEFRQYRVLFLEAFEKYADVWGTDFVVDHLIFLRQLIYRGPRNEDKVTLAFILKSRDGMVPKPCNCGPSKDVEEGDHVGMVLHLLEDTHLLKYTLLSDVKILKDLVQFIKKDRVSYWLSENRRSECLL